MLVMLSFFPLIQILLDYKACNVFQLNFIMDNIMQESSDHK